MVEAFAADADHVLDVGRTAAVPTGPAPRPFVDFTIVPRVESQHHTHQQRATDGQSIMRSGDALPRSPTGPATDSGAASPAAEPAAGVSCRDQRSAAATAEVLVRLVLRPARGAGFTQGTAALGAEAPRGAVPMPACRAVHRNLVFV